jgi:Aspartyl/Asparaginyl beta-hydroxylase
MPEDRRGDGACAAGTGEGPRAVRAVLEADAGRVDQACWFRVGSEVRRWEEGKGFAFNDTIEHEARNEGTGTRTVLIFNIWRPELSLEERGLVAALLESMDTL